VGGSSIADRKRQGLAAGPVGDLAAVQAQVVAALRAAGRVLITTHRSPDGDGVGSAAGLGGALASLGKDVTLYSADPIPQTLRFLAHAAAFSEALAPDARYDATVVTDCAELRRLGAHLPGRERRGTLIFVDHHARAGDEADIHFRDDTAPAVGEMVLRLVRGLGALLTVDIAEALYTSLLSDTGSFRYANTNPAAMRCAAELLEAGVDPWRVASHLYETEPPERLRLLQRVLATLDLSPDGRCAALCVTRGMLEATGASVEMADGFINHARSIAGVEVAVFFREIEGGAHEVSFRSRGKIDVGVIAALFGGGGTFLAAACTVPGDFSQVRARIYAAVEEALP
jgi:phosphoesterase RecJ-like protein